MRFHTDYVSSCGRWCKPKRRMKNLILSSLFLSTFATSAFAAVTDYPVDVYSRPTTLPEAVFEANLDLSINLSDNVAFKGFGLSPNLSYGVSKDITLALVHGAGAAGMRSPSLCLGDACGKAYNTVGLEARYQLTRGNDPTGLLLGLDAQQLSPEFALALRVGADFHLHPSDKLNINVAPQLGFGVTAREFANKEFVSVPVQFNWRQTENVNLQLLTGLNGYLDGFGDSYRVPVGVGVLYGTSDHVIDFGARFVLPALIAGDGWNGLNADGINSRELGLFVTFRN